MPGLTPYTHASVPPLKPFRGLPYPTTVALKWFSWIRHLQHYLCAMRGTDRTIKRSLLMHFRDSELHEVLETLPNTGGDADFDEVVSALNRHFDPQINQDYDRFKLQQAEQTETESIDMFYTPLRKLASTWVNINQQEEI
ncbi:hypothetical protein NDU88_001464 [Pleurodeles waltl]|uniref:Retrotransposon gag domain-containing protein n=1 Tax=Pleurodeles waltl TaxID=8319 RepID=A0AAV7R835_PLEWA|nr:hypothetical protein NDU88_001464 [Pleurodeles waltl]